MLAKDAKFRPGVMAALCPISMRQLERFFAKHFNKAPRAWTRELQLDMALRLISQGWSNKAVVEELGFANESHFCHEFKKFYGASPQSFAPVYGNQPVNGSGTGVAGNGARRLLVTHRELRRV